MIKLLDTRTRAGIFFRYALLSGLSAIIGCDTAERAKRDVTTHVENWQREQAFFSRQGQPLRVATARSETIESESRSGCESPTEGAADTRGRLQALIEEALANSPRVQAAIAEVRAKLERIPQATSWPDPTVGNVVYPESLSDANAEKYYMLTVEQMIPWPAKLHGAGAVAAAELRMALAELTEMRLGLIADVERAYWGAYLMDRYLELTAENQRLLNEMERVVLSQYEVGRVPQQDVLRVQTSRARLRDDEQRYRNQRIAATAAVNQLCDAVPERPLPPTTPLNATTAPLAVDALLPLAEARNPSLARLTEKIERDRELVRLADLNYLPDVMLGVEWEYMRSRPAVKPPPDPETGMIPEGGMEGRGDMWAIMLRMNLPIWFPRIEAARREARQNLLRSQHELRAERNMLGFRLYDAWSRFEARRRSLELLRDTLIPQARQTYDVTLAAYQAGTSGFIDVIEAWRDRLDFELMLHRETVDLLMAWSELEREAGLELVRTQAQAATAVQEE